MLISPFSSDKISGKDYASSNPFAAGLVNASRFLVPILWGFS